jgi:MFS transporter, FSR family, fosmidomycin resistance protein
MMTMLHLPTAATPVAYGIMHALIDLSTAGLLFAAIRHHHFIPQQQYFLIFLYNFLAFAMQPIFGFLTDRMKAPKITTLSGIVMVTISFAFFHSSPVAAIVMASIGNALFHIGGGVINLFVTPGRAVSLGIFIAPGDLGLWAGIYLGNNGFFTMPLMALLLALSAFAVFFINSPETYGDLEKIRIESQRPRAGLALLWLSVVVRTLVNTTGGYTLGKSPLSFGVLSAAAFFGKGIGGFVSDKFGWTGASVTALLISCPLIAFTDGNLFTGASGMLLLNIVMPLSATAMAGVIPKHPGLSMGLYCLALFLGSFIQFMPQNTFFHHSLTQMISIIVVALLLFAALSLFHKRKWKRR